MMKNSKPFYRTKNVIDFDGSCSKKRISCSNLLVDYDIKWGIHQAINKEDLRKLYTDTDINRLTSFSYIHSRGPIHDSHLTKILKNAKSLKNLSLEFGDGIEHFRMKILFQAISRLKLKSLTIIYASSQEPQGPSKYLQDLIVLLKKLSTLESLELKFQNVIFDEKSYSLLKYTLPLYNLKRLQITFRRTTYNGNKWIISFGRAVSKALCKNVDDIRTIELGISKDNCLSLTPLIISKFLENFDKMHITNYLNLEVILDSEQNENYPGYTFADLFSMLIRNKAKYKINSLHISHNTLSQDLEVMLQKNHNLIMNNLCLEITDDWDTVSLKESLKYMELFQHKKELKIVFPATLYNEIENEEQAAACLFDIVLIPMLSKVAQNMSLCLDLDGTYLFKYDFERLQSILSDIQKPISHLDFILLPRKEGFNWFGAMTPPDLFLALINLICSIRNVENSAMNLGVNRKGTCTIPFGQQNLIQPNKNSSLEKLAIRMHHTYIEPKAILQILNITLQLPKLTTIEVFCNNQIYQACQSISSLKSQDGKIVSCTFIQDSFS